MKSLIQSADECYVCRMNGLKTTGRLDTHHIMNGPYRKKSEQFYGLIKVCPYHHTLGGKKSIHGNPELQKKIKQDYQKAFELLYGHDVWMDTFDKNYLD